MQEFKVNNLITLRLEGKNTVIYVAGKRFQQCKYVLINIPKTEIQEYAAINSIDDAVDKKESFKTYYSVDITPKQ
ncbi:MAG: hypothetical protein HWN81_11585 [Candidatus Lokiarchaeota archaeon]|nr:hypothetical protein [Candidatus Lokiarchaeota archaeon]